MTDILKRLWWKLTLPAGWDTVRRTVDHTTLGRLEYRGTRSRPGGHVLGAWYVTVPGIAKPVSVGFPTMGGEPTPFYLDRLAAMLADQDGLFERFRTAITPEFEQQTESTMPREWRSAFTLDALDLPPAPDDVDEDGPIWQVTYWSPPAEHWIVVHMMGETVDYVEVAG